MPGMFDNKWSQVHGRVYILTLVRYSMAGNKLPYNIEVIKEYVKDEWNNAGQNNLQRVLIRSNLLLKYDIFVPNDMSFTEFYNIKGDINSDNKE